MAGVLQHLRSSTLDKRPNPASMVDGQIAINYASGAPGMFFKGSNGSLVKVGPVHVGSGAPNAVPASGGTAGNAIGEQWLDTSGGTYVFKIWDGAAWRSEAGEFVNATGDTMTGDLVMNNANVVFEGSVDDGFETTLTVVNPTADRTITLPNVTGTVVTTGDSGTVTSTMIADGTIVNADVNASAAIAGTKISPNFGSQTIQTTGIISAAGGSAAAPSIVFTGDTNTGIYSPGADQVAISTNGTGRLFVDASGRVGVGASPSVPLTVQADSNAFATDLIGRSADNTSIIRFKTSDNATALGSIGQYGTTMNLNSIGAGPIAFYTNDTERMRLGSSGRLGLGTSVPSSIFSVSAGLKSVNSDYIFLESTDVSNKLQLKTSNVANTVWSIQSEEAGIAYRNIALNPSGGNVGIGTTSPDAKIEVVENSTGSIELARLRIEGQTNNPMLRIFADEANKTVSLDTSGSTSGTELVFKKGGSEAARIDSSGRLLVGTSPSRPSALNAGGNLFQVAGSQTFYRSSADANSQFIEFVKGRAADAVVVSGDSLGRILFEGSDGTNPIRAAEIQAVVDGTPGTNDMPGRLVFSTTADGASNPTERARITSAGFFKASDNGTYFGATTAAHEFRTSATNVAGIISHATSTSYTDALHYWICGRSATNAYNFLVSTSGYGGVADDEFKLTGDGNGLCDGSWTGGGADYAEYFEWSDANPNAEDRRGISVVLDGDKIRPAADGEDPIGVISGNPSVVGDAAWNKWSEKYLRDEFGTYIQEDYEVANDDGNTVIQQRRKLNPAFDPDMEYTSREERPEWDCVGLMGKLRIRKGQPTGSRWIKMRDISDSVEEWLVR